MCQYVVNGDDAGHAAIQVKHRNGNQVILGQGFQHLFRLGIDRYGFYVFFHDISDQCVGRIHDQPFERNNTLQLVIGRDDIAIEDGFDFVGALLENFQQIAQSSAKPVQPIHPTPASQPDTAPTPAPVPNDLSKVLEGLQTLSAALQQWQEQRAPGVPATINSPSRVPRQSGPLLIAPVETSPTARANGQAEVQKVFQGSDRSARAYNYLEQQISNIIDRLINFNEQSQRQTEKWYISLNLFRDADLTHSLKSLRKVFSDRKPELDAHHQHHSLNHRQNTRHNAQDFKKQFAEDWSYSH